LASEKAYPVLLDALMTSRTRLTFALIGALALAAPTVGAQATAAAAESHPLFTWEDAALAGGFIAGTVALRPVDEYFAQHLQTKFTQQNRFFQTTATTVRTIAEPGAFIIGGTLYVVGRASKQRNIADLGLHGTEAVIVGGLFAGVLKNVFGRARPFVKPAKDSVLFDANNWQIGRGLQGDQYRSFPSGHAVAAFAAAAAVVNETSRWWPGYQWLIGPAMYGGAGLVGVSRMYNNRHWASDVMLGAAIGTFAGNKVVRYFHRTNPDNKLDQWLLGTSLRPVDGGGHAFSWFFVPAPKTAHARR
jgi:membrane-associated phospholipid phosphatase